jgi:hypothetical protein
VHAENVSAPYRLDVTNGDDATARYQLVVNNQSALTYETPVLLAPESAPADDSDAVAA